ncbi:MAG: thiamine pyrophosphate-binding protein [Simkaniaceae bacterium]|nr:thiamine pyrophosphate-binding protein [Simkaniaceae bacterium]
MIKLSDYVVNFLASQGIEHNFVVTGGAVVHLLDSTFHHPNIEHICMQHEESGGAAADGYFRASGKLGVAMTTSGPGATNLTTSICNAYFDSIPMICITGQVARFRLKPTKKMRQRGFQEVDIEAVFHSICKYVKLVTDPLMIRYELEKALFLAFEGRPGPVILDLPDDLQRVEIDPASLIGFSPPHTSYPIPSEQIESLIEMINQATRPVLIVGAGVRAAQAAQPFIRWAHYFKIPVLFTWGGADLLPATDPLNMGCVGAVGPRAGNFAAQYSDLVIALGTRLSQQITGGKQEFFAPSAKKVMVDIDTEELQKFIDKPFALDLAIHADLKDFFGKFELYYQAPYPSRFTEWRDLIQSWKATYPVCTKEDKEKPGLLNPYVFIKALSSIASEGEIFVTDTGANICWMMQSIETKEGQRIFSAWNHTPMGYSLPASIGACLGTGNPIVCLIGDGGLMMCVQELATVSRYNLPIKIFVFDNAGHATMKQTLEVWLEGKYVAVDEASGLSFPNYELLAAAFHLPYIHLYENEKLENELQALWQLEGPLVCRLQIDPAHRIVPSLKFGNSLECLAPPLPEEEILQAKAAAMNLTNVYAQEKR